MHRFVVFIFFVVVKIHADDGADPCDAFMKGNYYGFDCCTKVVKIPPSAPDIYPDCLKLAKIPPVCEADKCIAKRKGIAAPDGTVDTNLLIERIKKDFEDVPTLAEKIISECVKEDLSKYGPPDICQLYKIKICADVQVIKDCKKWRDDGVCSGIENLAKQCIMKHE